jgi:2-dehydropantoate 2-reductase
VTDLVVGGGAIGTLLAWALTEGGREVAIVRRGLGSAKGRAEVTVIDRDGARRTASVGELRTPDDLGSPPEVIVFAVKMFDLEAAAASCDVWPSSPSLTVANGVGAEAVVAGLRPRAPLIAGSITVSVEPSAERTVRRLNRGGIALAPVAGDATVIDGLLAAFDRAGLRTARKADAAAMKWSKLLANLVGNASSAILDLSPAEVYAHPGTFGVERRQLLEALAVMRLLGLAPVALPGADVRWLALAARLPAAISRPILRRIVGGARGGKDPSLRLHVRSGSGPSEVAWLNGAVAREADRLDLRAPINRGLAELVDAVVSDPDRRAWFRGRPDRLVEALEAHR